MAELAAQLEESPSRLDECFTAVRHQTVSLCAHLTPEDCNLQAMADTSPAKWHLAHTTWFFETFVLVPFRTGYESVDPQYTALFNSYYNGIGEQFPRPRRSLLSRPALEQVYGYRASVDAGVAELLADDGHPRAAQIHERVELGLHHEAQHQELILTDLKYCLFQNPLLPAYRDGDAPSEPRASTVPLAFIDCPGGQANIGHAGDEFCFDNELPGHPELVAPFQLANRLVTNGEFRDFVDDGGYDTPAHWLADGWALVRDNPDSWRHPLYWIDRDGRWDEYTLDGVRPLDAHAPVAHVSYYEAQAYASWAGKRLPTEAEWESAGRSHAVTGNLLDADRLQPRAATGSEGGLLQLYGDAWEWTNSAYLPYPGYRPLPGAVGEYNGKFMSGQMVLRGGSCLSAAFHIRPSYRNFFYPPDRWQCAGIRLATD